MMATAQDLREAKEAYKKLVTGQLPRVVVDQNGERVEFTATNASLLKKYINELERELGVSSFGPMRVWF